MLLVMCRISGIVRPSRAQVRNFEARTLCAEADILTGSGCVAALEAEKFLADQDDSVSNELETENQAEKSQTNGVVPEYRSNPLL